MISLEQFAIFFVFSPLLAILLHFAFIRTGELTASRIARGFSALQLIATLVIAALHLGGILPVEFFEGAFHFFHHTFFSWSFVFDGKAIAFLTLGNFLVWIVIHYCHYYLHREDGYARFFRNLFLFQFGIQVVSVAHNLDLFFIGWEMVGVSSFLLVSFYRNRAAPVLNAFRIYFVYRVCDLGILFAAWMVHQHLHTPLLGFLILFAAMGKSAQFPFSFWLPRAMEGPTPSSAIFYGALAIHAGVFALLRTSPLWNDFESVRYAIGIIGAISWWIGTVVSRTQSNIKGQIAYASIAQVGIMFVEIALGWETLAFIHLILHTALRCYQLLASPSVVAHLIQHPLPEEASPLFSFLDSPRWRRLSLGEFFLEDHLKAWIIDPLRNLSLFMRKQWIVSTLLAIAISWIIRTWIDSDTGCLFLGTCLSLAGFAFSGRSFRSWIWGCLSILCLSLTLDQEHDVIFLLSFGSILPAIGLWFLGKHHPSKKFNEGCLVFAWLILAGFPISTFYLGEDLLLHRAAEINALSAVLFGLVFVFNGILFCRSLITTAWLREELP